MTELAADGLNDVSAEDRRSDADSAMRMRSSGEKNFFLTMGGSSS